MLERVTVKCPCCGYDLEVSYQRGWRDYDRPPDPPDIDWVDGCDCYEYLNPLAYPNGEAATTRYWNELLERVEAAL